MIVVYYISTHYLDAAIETIQSIKNEVDLHVIIELSPESKTSNIIDVDNLNEYNDIEIGEVVLGIDKWNQIKGYFEGISSLRFVIHKFKRSFSFASLKVSSILAKYIKSLHPDIIHFDSISTRMVGLLPSLISKNTYITVHDPLPHTGEESWKIKVVEYFYFKLAKGFFFYSDFAKKQFTTFYKSLNVQKVSIRFQPFSYIKQFPFLELPDNNYILFFGRILPYKGVDMLLEAIPHVLSVFPNQKFVIAGSPFNCDLNYDIIYQFKDNIELVSTHISIENLSNLIANSKFIVCPYRDATQSGVLMTAYALGKMVLGSNVGAFPEYIINDLNGVLTEPNINSIATSIIDTLSFDRYKVLERNINSDYSITTSNYNRDQILSAYNK